MTIPREGSHPDRVAAAADELRAHDAPVHGGRVLAYVYDSGVEGLDGAARGALASFGGVNGRDPTVLPSVRALENDLVGWGLDLLGGGSGSCGVVTSGGTESCILAVLAAREDWRRRGGTGTPRLVMPVTAHPAFIKGAHLLGLRPVVVPVDPQTMRVRLQDVESALDHEGESVALVVGSAPSYPHGMVDPIAELAALAAARGGVPMSFVKRRRALRGCRACGL